jgi:hypothetical protein
MISVVIRRTEEPKVIQMTQSDLVKQLGSINGAEIILEDTWSEGLKKVRTPYVSLVEPDCVFSANYYTSNMGIMKKAHEKVQGHVGQPEGGGGYQKLAMIASCFGVKNFANRIYSYELDKVREGMEINGVQMKGWHIQPDQTKRSNKLYHVQVGFIPGAVIRMSAIKDIIEDALWNGNDLVKLSTALSFYLWDSGRRIQVNPNTTYVSNDDFLQKPPLFETRVPDKVANIFHKEGIGFSIKGAANA